MQRTVRRPVELSGVGLHSGAPVTVRLCPAPENSGIVFRRTDLRDFEIEAHMRHVSRVVLATTLMKKGVMLSTVEHLLSALYGLAIDNLVIEIDSLEGLQRIPRVLGRQPPDSVMARHGSTSIGGGARRSLQRAGAAGSLSYRSPRGCGAREHWDRATLRATLPRTYRGRTNPRCLARPSSVLCRQRVRRSGIVRRRGTGRTR